jgi:hypothetical protein
MSRAQRDVPGSGLTAFGSRFVLRKHDPLSLIGEVAWASLNLSTIVRPHPMAALGHKQTLAEMRFATEAVIKYYP